MFFQIPIGSDFEISLAHLLLILLLLKGNLFINIVFYAFNRSF